VHAQSHQGEKNRGGDRSYEIVSTKQTCFHFRRQIQRTCKNHNWQRRLLASGTRNQVECLCAPKPKIHDQKIEQKDGLQPESGFQRGCSGRAKPFVPQHLEQRRQADDVIVNHENGARVHDSRPFAAATKKPLLAGKGEASEKWRQCWKSGE
jgi:hypothetical protein